MNGSEKNFDPDVTGKVLGGRYRIDSVIGKGGMGTVYLATDQNLSRQVVVKVPHPKFLSGSEFAGRFEKEIKSLITLEHPSLVKVLDGGTAGDLPYAVLQYLPGGNLEGVLKQRAGRMSAADVLTWLTRIASALDFVHKSGVVHRGVKPGNILFDRDGNPFLADFGVVKSLGEKDANATITGATPGSSEYMGPEAATPGDLTPAFDQYGLAVIAYESLAGKLPFHGQTGLASMVVKQAKPAQPLTDAAPTVPAGVAAAVMRALERDPAKRFPTCTAFAEAFAAGAASAAPGAPPPPTSSSSETRVVRKSDVPTAMRVDVAAAAAAVSRPPPAPLTDDPHATRLIPKAGAKKVAPPPDLPTGASPRKVGGKGKWIAVALVVLLGGGAAAYFAMQSEPEIPISLEVTSPVPDFNASNPDVLIRGTMKTPNPGLDRVKVGGVEVIVTGGKWERMVTLPTEGTHKIDVTVEGGGKVKKSVEVRIAYRAFWRPVLDAAKDLAGKGEWVAAKEKLALAKSKGAAESDFPPDVVAGIARYEAPPALKIEAPADGTTLDKPSVVVKGTFSSGRATDKLKVDGKDVAAVEGEWSATVAVAEGTREIVVSVEDGATTRKKASVHVTYVRPPEPWEGWLKGWAAPADDKRDKATGFPTRVLRIKDGAEMVLIPAGTFQMGAGSKAKIVVEDEKPGHAVTISKAFYMDATEVTVAEWRKSVAAGQGQMPNLGLLSTKEDMPVYNVNHDAVAAFARWVGCALPTEAQWEYAAKGGHDDYGFPWGLDDDESKRNGQGENDRYKDLAPVKSFPANDFGLYDMAGNVWEWCADWYDEKYYVTSTPTDPTGPQSGTKRVLRGGGWEKDTGIGLRVSRRLSYAPETLSPTIGFRCVKSLP